MRDIAKKLEKLESVNKRNFNWKPGEITQLAVFISSEPQGKTIGKFDDLDEAKRECKRIARDFDVPNMSWLFELPDGEENVQLDPPYFVVIGEVKSWIEEVG